MRRGIVACLVAALAATGALAPAGATAAVPGVPWTNLMPPLPSPNQERPKKVRHCPEPTLECVRVQIRRMQRLQGRLGCDHRAVFTTTYLTLTRQLKKTLKADPHFFRFEKYFFQEDAVFANVYFRVIKAWNRGEPVPDAWRIAFEHAASGDANGAQDMLMGINAHVQNDMPFVLAHMGLRNKKGQSRKPDHDKANLVLNAGYEPVVRQVRRRYDPILSLTNPDWMPIDDVAGLEVVRGWREQVWRNAERLVNADTAAKRRQVATQIEQAAAIQATLIGLPQQPGYRATRDAYCQEQLG